MLRLPARFAAMILCFAPLAAYSSFRLSTCVHVCTYGNPY
jgi:hypothetical protein